jgi:hypothetical protein
MPGAAFPPVGRLGLTSPPSPVLCGAKTATLSVSGRFACRSRPDTLLAPVVRGLRFRLVARWKPPGATPGSLSQPAPQTGNCCKETGGSPKFPSYPYRDMPRSQTPVVSWALAMSRPGLLPSGQWKPSAFPSIPPEGYPTVHNYTLFGAPSRGLSPRSLQLRTPITGCARGGHYRPAG